MKLGPDLQCAKKKETFLLKKTHNLIFFLNSKKIS